MRDGQTSRELVGGGLGLASGRERNAVALDSDPCHELALAVFEVLEAHVALGIGVVELLDQPEQLLGRHLALA